LRKHNGDENLLKEEKEIRKTKKKKSEKQRKESEKIGFKTQVITYSHLIFL